DTLLALDETAHQNSLANIRTETAELEKRHAFALEAIQQEIFKNQAELSIAGGDAAKRADAERDIAALKIQLNTEEIKYQTELKKLAGEKAQIELESDQARYKRLLEYRDAVRAFYEDVRSIQTKVDE